MFCRIYGDLDCPIFVFMTTLIAIYASKLLRLVYVWGQLTMVKGLFGNITFMV
jgi:hypothetical protein